MKNRLFKYCISLLTLYFLITGFTFQPVIKYQNINGKNSARGIKEEFINRFNERKFNFDIPRGSKVDSIVVDPAQKKIIIYLSRAFSYNAYREDNVKKIYSEVERFFGKEYEDYHFSIVTLGHPVEELIPNFFRGNSSEFDLSRIPAKKDYPAAIVKNVSRKYDIVNGLEGRNIAVAPSHGWYYNVSSDRWEWQRPRLFESVEDLLPNSFCIEYLIPMLENAGANVFDPRERDIQTNEVVVDNDTRSDISNKYYTQKNGSPTKWRKGSEAGFATGNPPYPVDYNPFTKGSYVETEADAAGSSGINWIPDIPEEGKYAVYISYHASDKNVNDAQYTVYHQGIKTVFAVNQQIGGGMWQYLGTFKFGKGFNPEKNKVVLTNRSKEKGKIVTADAVRFGGGMGIVTRGGKTSGRPKFVEGSRYYLQYNGMPDSLIYNFNNDKDDYNDDKQDRSKYINYLNGGSVNDPGASGLGVPVDLSLAFHTDAGVTHNNKVIGTLSLYGNKGEDSKETFPNGVSRLASRDLADVMQTQIVEDIRAQFDPDWSRRQLMNEQPSNDAYPQQYSEVYRPNVPAVLIELLSHQNFVDMRFGQDPAFKFAVARAMYKGMLKFLSVQYGFKYIVQPLPVKAFSSEIDNSGSVILKWKPISDSLEPTAVPDYYIVYTRINNGDFDNGFAVDKPEAIIKNIKEGNIYSFKVTAVNKGGESFPSEILSVYKLKNSKPALIINGFTRVAPPAVELSENRRGFINNIDNGVPDKYDISFTGDQFNFDPYSPWKSNDNSGWGNSYADYEDKVIAGNTFDYPYIHGISIRDAGHSFVSASVDAVTGGSVDLNNYNFVDLILGEQKTTSWQKPAVDSLKGKKFKTFPEALQNEITSYLKNGGNIFISGSYVASDLFNEKIIDSTGIMFAQNMLKYTLDTDHASKGGTVFSVKPDLFSIDGRFDFNTKLNNKLYASESPDGVAPINGSQTILRYYENKFSAATAYKGRYGVIVFGFPFETIKSQAIMNKIMAGAFKYFNL